MRWKTTFKPTVIFFDHEPYSRNITGRYMSISMTNVHRDLVVKHCKVCDVETVSYECFADHRVSEGTSTRYGITFATVEGVYNYGKEMGRRR